MRIYSSCKAAASELQRELKEMGKEVKLQTMQDKRIEGDPAYYTQELLGYSYMIANTGDKDEMLKAFDKMEGKTWAEAEFQERIGLDRVNPGSAWRNRPDVWNEFIHDGKFAYTYSDRMADQVEKIITELGKHESSRQGIISIWDKNIDTDRLGKERVPCSMFYQVIKREGKLQMIYVTRSNDLYEHWPYDVWLAIRLQEYIAERLGIPTGGFYQFITSFHTYAYKQKGVF